MAIIDSLGDRQKRHELSTTRFLTTRVPVIVRLDGRAFHTYTKGFNKPYDARIIKAMANAAKSVAKEMNGFKIGYIQSDEATFVMTDMDSLEMQPWFGYTLDKIVSISASIMTANFNQIMGAFEFTEEEKVKGLNKRLAVFDGRAFNIPLDDVSNNLLWRARDWHRNSINSMAQSIYPQRELNGLNIDMVLDKLKADGHDWNKLPNVVKYGTFIFGKPITIKTDCLPDYNSVNELFKKTIPS